MRKAPKRGHRVTNRTCNHPGLPASRGLLPLEMLTYRLFIESPMRTQLAVDGFLAKFWYHRHPALPHMSLTLPFFHGSSPGPGGAFLKGNYLPKNTHETAEPVVNGKPICVLAKPSTAPGSGPAAHRPASRSSHFDRSSTDNVTPRAELRPDGLKRRANCANFAAFFLDDGLADF